MQLDIDPVANAIQNHRTAILADEATFDADGKSLNEAESQRTQEAEIKAFQRFLAAPCLDAADVQAKIAYLLDGTIGERNALMACVAAPEYGGNDDLLMKLFLRSLLISQEHRA